METNIFQAKKTLLAIFVILSSSLASAETVQIDGIWYNLIAKVKQASVVKNPDNITKYSGDIVIPSNITYDNVEYIVTCIEEHAFGDSRYLNSITIPQEIVSIKSWAFAACSNLTSVYINNISAWCNIDFDSNFSNPLNYAKMYLNEKLVTNLVIPDSVKIIKEHAFEYCQSLTSITFSKELTSIENGAFYGCSQLSTVIFSDSLRSIGDDCFSYCKELTSISLPESVTSLGRWAFYGCCKLDSITLSDKIKRIESSTFENCINLKSITLPTELTYIGGRAFAACTNLADVTIPNNIKDIDYQAFCDCI